MDETTIETNDRKDDGPKDMVVGFLFTPNGEHVVLISKTHPEWQAGSLNGVGGKVDPWETAEEAMRREFREETGADIEDWRKYSTLRGTWGSVTFFAAFGHPKIQAPTDEIPGWYAVADLYKLKVVPNLRWLVPMALDHVTATVETNS